MALLNAITLLFQCCDLL